MAERRMFAKTIIDSDAFLDMPISARLLYYDLGMRADDDGFVNSPKKIMKMIGATYDDMNILIARKFVIPFDSGIVVIKHWRINNYLRSDRYHETQYAKEKDDVGIPGGIPSIGKPRLGKDRLGKDTIYDSKESSSFRDEGHSEYKWIMDAWNELEAYGVTPVKRITKHTTRADMIRARLKQYSQEDILDAIENIKKSDFLLGRSGKFVITFDWFIRPNNFLKVLEGNYNKRNSMDKTVEILQNFINEDD